MEIENLRRALSDIKYQNEENIRVISCKDEENRRLQRDLETMREIIDKGGQEIQRLQDIIADLEDKNRKMNEKLNEVIYNRATAYKQRTLQALKMTSSPERREKI